MQILDVTNIIIDEDKLVCTLFDGRYDAIAVVRFVPNDKEDTTKGYTINVDELNGEERVRWLDEFGLLSEDEIEAEYYNLSLKPAMKKALYRKFKLDFED